MIEAMNLSKSLILFLAKLIFELTGECLQISVAEMRIIHTYYLNQFLLSL